MLEEKSEGRQPICIISSEGDKREETPLEANDIDRIAEKWIVDSGASRHITGRSKRDLVSGFIRKMKEQIFDAAGGPIAVKNILKQGRAGSGTRQ